ncbi:MAG: anaerobic ribonucleoside-triphosphate reductase [Acidilobaceae archaeon]
MEVFDVYESYVERAEWLTRDNANIPESIGGLLNAMLGEALYQLALRIVPRRALELHEEGWVYVYKLRDGSAVKPYCGGIDARLLVEKGLKTPTVVSSPPRHLDSAVDQMVNAMYSFSFERTGAIGLYGVDLNLAPFVEKDGLSYAGVKQNIQRLVYNLNYPLKTGQSPFTNVILAFSNRMYRAQPLPGLRLGELYESYVGRALEVVKALAEVFSEGDSLRQPFTFPITTSLVNRDFEKLLESDGPLWEKYWGMVSEVGQMYFLNGFNHRAEDLFSFCCRLISDMDRVREHLRIAKGVWDMPPSVGSVNVVVVNAPRLAFTALASDESRAFEKLDELLEAAREALNALRAQYLRLHRLGFYPMTAEYIDRENPFKYYYNTIGVIGMAEYAAIMSGDPGFWTDGGRLSEALSSYEKLLNYIHERLAELEEEDGVLYNVEEVPGETLGVKLAEKDLRWLKARGRQDLALFIPVGELPEGKKPFYTNQLTPPYSTAHLRDQLWLESRAQPMFTGGVMKHVFVDRRLPPDVVARFVLRVMRETSVVYMSITPTIAVCPRCRLRQVGRMERCPRCGEPLDVWSRIVGYYRPIRMWNSGRRAEFAIRRDYSEEVLEIAGD